MLIYFLDPLKNLVLSKKIVKKLPFWNKITRDICNVYRYLVSLLNRTFFRGCWVSVDPCLSFLDKPNCLSSPCFSRYSCTISFRFKDIFSPVHSGSGYPIHLILKSRETVFPLMILTLCSITCSTIKRLSSSRIIILAASVSFIHGWDFTKVSWKSMIFPVAGL